MSGIALVEAPPSNSDYNILGSILGFYRVIWVYIRLYRGSIRVIEDYNGKSRKYSGPLIFLLSRSYRMWGPPQA